MTGTENSIERVKREAQERNAELKARKESAPPAPSIQALCLEQTLYAPIQMNPERDEAFLERLRYGTVQFDAHCVYCGTTVPFRTMSDRDDGEYDEMVHLAKFNDPAREKLKRLKFESGQFALHIGCSRRPEHSYSYFFLYDERQAILTKIGQIPSVEDVAGTDIERYRRVLGSDFPEMRKATGLFAHGIGIGSFVYLRRIFENLVESARQSADPEGKHKAEFMAMRMSERVKELADHLPPSVVKYKEAYGILSQGIHELTEADCKQYFPVLRAAIIAMLEQRYEAAEKAKALDELDRAVAALSSQTSKS